ncbi:MAG TPA: HlyD family efflux transporter periplasmic adaptor subunit [Paracoccaceae bacterium]
MKPRQAILILVGLAVAVGLAGWAFRPTPLQVDLVPVQSAPMQVTVAAEGVTRIRNPYEVTAPIAGALTRSPVQVGDRVIKDETVLAVIHPGEPAFLDARARLQAEAAVTEAEAALRVAEARLQQAATDLSHAEAEFTRTDALAARGTVAQRRVDDVAATVDSARAAHAAAQSTVDLQRATLQRMQAQFRGPAPRPEAADPDACCVELRAPQSGTVLAVESISARPVQAGAPLLTIGDLTDMEIEVDLLSSDAVRIAPGAPARVERWGGDTVLQAVVRSIDPSAHSKVSALGIEEQRVRCRLDILTPPEARPGLGDNFRVFVHIEIWAEDAVLQVPIGALFRNDGQWMVFRENGGRAVMTAVEVGRQTSLTAQIVAGLAEGDRVVAFPGNAVEDGSRITDRREN